MEEQILIGKGTWIDKVADTLIKREKKLGRSLDLIWVESGLGASGIQHIGSMGDKVGIKYRFQSGREAYRQGILIEQIDIILKNSSKLGQKIAEFVGQDKYIEVLPYFPVCHNCGRLYTAVAQKYLPEEKKVAYVC